MHNSDSLKSRVQEFLQHHQRWIPVTSFFVGFLYDILTLGEIDEWWNITQQMLFLGIVFILILFDSRYSEVGGKPQWIPVKLWNYRDIVIHFGLGALLSSYTLFFFKSASLSTSILFLFFMMALMVLNEVPRIQSSGLGIRLILFFVCSTSFSILMVPLAIGRVGFWVFILSLIFALLLHFCFFKIYSHVTSWSYFLRKRVICAGLLVPIIFLLAYFLKWIPPVPFAVKYMGIFHGVEKRGDDYELLSTRDRWRFWENGDQTFIANAGDRIYCFIRLFSPGGVKDQVYVKWFFKDSVGGWKASDRIPLDIVGGRREGFRGFTYKANYQEGDWRVSVETSDGREIGRVSFTVTFVK